MQAQDPLNPMKDTEFIAQIGELHLSLEQMKTLTKSFDTFSTRSARRMPRTTSARRSRCSTATRASSSGTVSSVSFQNDEPRIVVNDTPYDPAFVQSIQISAK